MLAHATERGDLSNGLPLPVLAPLRLKVGHARAFRLCGGTVSTDKTVPASVVLTHTSKRR